MDSINLSLSKLKALTMLSMQGYARVMQAVVLYASCGEETDFDDPTQTMAFSLLSADVEDIAKKHTKSVNNGKKGGRPKKVSQEEQQVIELVNDNISSNDDIFDIDYDDNGEHEEQFDSKKGNKEGEQTQKKTQKTPETQVFEVFEVFQNGNNGTEEKEKEKESGVKKKKDKEKNIYNARTRERATDLGRVIPPTLEMVTDYCRQRGYDMNIPERFINFYGSKGWLVGKSKMVDWHHAIGNWASNAKTYNTGYNTNSSGGGYRTSRVDDNQTYNPYADLPRL